MTKILVSFQNFPLTSRIQFSFDELNLEFFTSMENDTEIYHLKIRKLSEERVNFLRNFTVRGKNYGLHIARVINSTSLSILAHCSYYLGLSCVGNPLALIKYFQSLYARFPMVIVVLTHTYPYT